MLKRDAPPRGAGPEALVAGVVDHPATRKSASSAGSKSGTAGLDLAIFLISLLSGRVKVLGGAPPVWTGSGK